MNCKVVILACLSAACLFNCAHAARPRWRKPRGGKDWSKLKRSVERHFTRPAERDVSGSSDTHREEPLKWLTDYENACALAGREKRPLMMLFTSEEISRTSPRCRFSGDPVRRTVRKCGVVPLKVLPPKYPEVKNLSEEEAATRRKEYAESHKRYLTLTGKFRVHRGPALVFAAPDGTVLLRHVVPADSQIIASCWKARKILDEHQRQGEEKGASETKGKPDEESGQKPAAEESARHGAARSEQAAGSAEDGRKEPAKEGNPEKKVDEPVIDPEDF
jgi:hypothetical protein